MRITSIEYNCKSNDHVVTEPLGEYDRLRHLHSKPSVGHSLNKSQIDIAAIFNFMGTAERAVCRPSNIATPVQILCECQYVSDVAAILGNSWAGS